MKRILIAIITALSVCSMASAQIVSWSIEERSSDGDVHTVMLKASIAPGYHIYDTEDYAGGPNPTVIRFAESPAYELIGDLRTESEIVKYNDELFNMEIGIIETEAVFVQDIRLVEATADVSVNVEWMACNDGSCIPPADVDLSIKIGSAGKGNASAGSHADAGLLAMLLAAVLWGLAALLTPCVFPMIPMTVSFFLKGSDDKATGRFRAIMYGVFIVLLYTVPIAVIILLTRLIGGDAVTADIFNWLSTHWLPNILFFVIFMIFAASFFGAFEIVLPSKIVNGSDSKAETSKGLGGVFFLALTLVLVSFSCTGPIVGSVLIRSTAGEFWAPILTMLVFSTVFALPFVLFALFPGFLKKMPKSGGWLNSVKVVLGFVEVALGFKFLSTADQVYHWGLLDREVYLAIWIVCFTLLGFYLLGKLKFKHDSELEYVSTFRLALSIVVFSFVVYMIPGMWGAPLKALSGYLPPMETQDFVIGAASSSSVTATSASAGTRKYSDVLELPLGLEGYFDLAEAEAAAKAEGKPLFIDFTGHGCVNCREMESRVWSDPRVLELLRDSFIICALYTDDKLEAPQSDWITADNGKVLKTIGRINSNIALSRYGVAAQPNYVIQDPQGRIVCPARGYDLDVEAFRQFLLKGIEDSAL